MKFSAEKVMGKKQTIQAGKGLLSNVSSTYKMGKMDIEYIQLENLVPNNNNDYSMDSIETLANLINMSGLEQPLIVKEADELGRHVILTGHRRFKAIQILSSQGKWESGVVPCIVKDVDAIELPLSYENKELFSIVTTNQYRNKTDGDKLLEKKAWEKIIGELRKNGMSDLPIGLDADGNEVVRPIKNVKTRDIVADQLGESPAQIGKYQKVENQGSDKLINALKEDKVTVAQANLIAGLSEDTQDEIIDKVIAADGTLKKKKIKKIISDVTEKKEPDNQEPDKEEPDKEEPDKEEPDNQETDSIIITKKLFESDLKEIFDIIRIKEVKISSEQQFEYLKHIKGILDILK